MVEGVGHVDITALQLELLRCLSLVLFLAAVARSPTKMTPLNLTLCDESSGNVRRLMTDVFVLQPQNHSSCSQLTNTSTPVVRDT